MRRYGADARRGGCPTPPTDGHGAEAAVEAAVAHNVAVIGVIGGSGFYSFFDSDARSLLVETPYGQPSAPITVGRVGCHEVAFLPRHGLSHEYSPHTVPYRANMWALRALGVRRVFGPCAVGSLSAELGAGSIVVPDQLVDRTRGRADTYFDSGGIHVEFADPYCPHLRAVATEAPGVIDGGTMVVIQGPRFSTRAESQWFARQGFTLVNMTGYPEAVLARELEMCYAAIALVTDVDAGLTLGAGVRAVDVFAEFERNIGPFKELVHGAIDRVASERVCTHCLAHEGVELPFDLP
jgi:5'-methylthioadenosine phosphorylase